MRTIGGVNSFFLRGNVYYGWITHGQYKDYKPITVDINKAKASDGNTFDGTVGLGFLVPIYDWSFGPVGGYAYDRVSFKLHHAKTDGTSNHAMNGSRYDSSWQGWWLGPIQPIDCCGMITHSNSKADMNITGLITIAVFTLEIATMKTSINLLSTPILIEAVAISFI